MSAGFSGPFLISSGRRRSPPLPRLLRMFSLSLGGGVCIDPFSHYTLRFPIARTWASARGRRVPLPGFPLPGGGKEFRHILLPVRSGTAVPCLPCSADIPAAPGVAPKADRGGFFRRTNGHGNGNSGDRASQSRPGDPEGCAGRQHRLADRPDRGLRGPGGVVLRQRAPERKEARLLPVRPPSRAPSRP